MNLFSKGEFLTPLNNLKACRAYRSLQNGSNTTRLELKKYLKQRSEIKQQQQHSIYTTQRGNSLEIDHSDLKNGIQGTSFRINSESCSQPSQNYRPRKIFNQTFKVPFSKHSPETGQGYFKNKLEAFCLQKSLEKRAKEFVQIVNLQKKKFKGRLFLLKKEEEQKHRINHQLQQVEKNLIKCQYQEKRRKIAEQNIKALAKKSQIRQLKIQKSRTSSKNTNKKQRKESAKRKSFFIMEKSDDEPWNAQHLSNFRYLNQTEKQIEQARKKLVELVKIMKKEELFLKNKY